MKKAIYIILILIMLISFTACSNKNITPQPAQMKSICELATMKCYYHNVAKYEEKDATGIWMWKKDRKFWVEYSGVITIGIDASLLNIEVDGENVTIMIPPAKVLGCKVDEKTLNADSFIAAKDSASIKAEHQTLVFQEAQNSMLEDASNDTALLSNAQERTQKLLTDYINNIGECTGITYNIKWVYIDGDEDVRGFGTDNIMEDK